MIKNGTIQEYLEVVVDDYSVEDCGVLAKYDLSIFDCTPWINENRPHEIAVWLSMWNALRDVHEHVFGFVSLDDDFTAKQYAKYGMQHHLIKTTFYGKHGGLQPEHVQQAIDILNRQI